ncbi:MAG: tetratricopeptide repeat protein [Acidobacteriota bacterium]|nr:tetratricopeptide repeat protein [Acidobacteriota bacterium]
MIPLLSGEALNAVATTRSTLASTIADQGRFSDALQTAGEAVDEYRHRGDTSSPSYAFSLNVLGGFLTDAGNFVEADNCLREADTIFRRLMNPLNLWFGDNLRNQSISFYQQGKYQAANDRASEASKIYLESFGPHYDHYPTTLIIKGLSLARMGQSKEGERLLREALKIRTDSLPREHFWVAQAKGALGEGLTIQKRYEEAEALLLESYHSLNQSQGAQNPRTLLSKTRLVDLYQQWNKPNLAATYRAAAAPKT